MLHQLPGRKPAAEGGVSCWNLLRRRAAARAGKKNPLRERVKSISLEEIEETDELCCAAKNIPNFHS
ncbi:hypothetical protein ACFOLJ_28855 [Rugamonas sp. CCM 8940]|uniref:hypothetical protein n=1 Tax=Rugamonas sp. CCM 8940 TaxID=2765359 RepID=UPI0018F6D60B|nr:hypothetical protein [Rugamonas sp. CCM 8940]MBJ7313743.1 hypothetical protein [Rugamonas sp. CCM 8940]